MPEQTPRTLSHFAFYRFNQAFFALPPHERKRNLSDWWSSLSTTAAKVDAYQLYPAHTDADLLVWSAVETSDPEQAGTFFSDYACQTNPFRGTIQPVQSLWGFTRPSEYTKTRSNRKSTPLPPNANPTW